MNNSAPSGSMLPKRSPAASPLVAGGLILLCVLAAYGNSVSSAFLVDDGPLITDNYLLRQPDKILELLRTPYLENYFRPVTLLSFFCDYRLWGPAAPGFHSTNILLHFANALLLFFLLGRLFGRSGPALLAAMLFAVHPIHAVALNYVADRGNLLAALFSLACLIFIDKAADKAGRRALALRTLAVFAFLLALLSRESAVLLPAYAVACVIIKRRPVPRGERLFLAALFLAAGAYVLLTRHLLPMLIPRSPILFSAGAIGAFSYTIVRYLGLLLWPDRILWVREIRLIGPETFLYPALILCIAVLAALSARRSRAVLFAVLWSLAGFLPLYFFMGARPHLGFIMQDNQIYLASIGPLFLAAWGIARLVEASRSKMSWLLVACLLCLYALSARSFNASYRDPESFLRDWLRQSPHSDIAAANLSQYYEKKGDMERALHYCLINLTGGPRDATRLLSASIIYQDMKKYAESEACLKKALEIAPDRWDVLYNLGVFFWKRGDTAQAETFFREAVSSAPSVPWPRQSLIVLWDAQGRRREAIAAAQQMRRQFPSFRPIGFHLITWYLEGKRLKEAREEARAMLEDDDQPAATGLALAGVFYRSGCSDEAVLLLDDIRARYPQQVQTLLDSGIVEQQDDEVTQAVALWRSRGNHKS
ncbi:MAG: tetratricopeptide repeat protein [Deltaproteobacteria bacterium]